MANKTRSMSKRDFGDGAGLKLAIVLALWLLCLRKKVMIIAIMQDSRFASMCHTDTPTSSEFK